MLIFCVPSSGSIFSANGSLSSSALLPYAFSNLSLCFQLGEVAVVRPEEIVVRQEVFDDKRTKLFPSLLSCCGCAEAVSYQGFPTIIRTVVSSFCPSFTVSIYPVPISVAKMRDSVTQRSSAVTSSTSLGRTLGSLVLSSARKSMASTSATSGVERDPMNIGRLAQDLAQREQHLRTTSDADAELPAHELPLLLPLSHSHPLLSAESNAAFDVDAFLLTRSNTSLGDLRTELRDYLAVLKEELVQLINDDYADFISLRTDLRGEGARLERLEEPLANVGAEIDVRALEVPEMQLRTHLNTMYLRYSNISR